MFLLSGNDDQLTQTVRRRPKKLDLTAADEITVMENLDIFASNGFGITVDENAPYGQGEKIRLIAMPVSKDTVFDEKGALCA